MSLKVLARPVYTAALVSKTHITATASPRAFTSAAPTHLQRFRPFAATNPRYQHMSNKRTYSQTMSNGNKDQQNNAGEAAPDVSMGNNSGGDNSKAKQSGDLPDPHNNEHVQAAADWQKRAPYRIHESNEHFKERYEASCHCGKVEYELSREEPLDSKLCHCTTCQTQHAAPFQWAAIFKKDDINFKNGHHNLEWYDPTSKSIEHKLPCKVRCKFCHSPIMDEGRNMILLFPSLIKFKSEQDKKNFKPRLHMFYGQRVMDIPDGLPKWTGLNEGEDSYLIEDSPPEMVKELERKRMKEQKGRVDRGENSA